MTDYSRLDETTLRMMLDASSDLDERQQLRSILRRLKKHSNTISFSPTNRENIMNKNHNNALPLMARWEQTSSHLKSSSSPNPNEILPRHGTALEKNVLSPIVNCNEVLDNSTDVNSNGKTDRSVFQVINKNFSGSQDNGTADLNRSWSIMSEGNIHKPVDNSKQTLGKRLSEPISMDLPKLTRSRLIIQQMLAPRMAAAAKEENVQETTQLTTTFAPRVAAIATQGNVQETITPNTTHALQVDAEPTQGSAQEITPPNKTLSVQDDHSKSSDTSNSREAAPSYVDNDKPMFTRTLCDISDATLGETVVLDCKVVARLRPMVLWYRNSQLIPVHSQRYAQSYDADLARLTIRSVGYDIVGVYECAARNAFGKVTTACQLQLKGDTERQNFSSLSGQMATPPTPKVTIRRSETLPTSTMAMRIINSAARRKMEASLREDPVKKNEAVEVVSHPEEVEEEAVARSTRTEKASDGGKVTTTTTVTTHKTKDGAHLVTKQTKQITRVGGVGTTNYSINKCSAEEIAERLSGIFEKKALCGTGGVIVVKTENWNSQDGITHRNEKSQLWEAPRLALSFNEADMASKYGDAGLTPLQRSATTVKQRLLEWCRVTLKDYKNISISNFSTSWNDGMAFCALVHHFIPDAFDYSQLEPKNRRENFQLAFDTAEKRAGIVPLLDVEDMVGMTVPDWKCVFMYVQSIYREFVLPKPLQQRSANNAA